MKIKSSVGTEIIGHALRELRKENPQSSIYRTSDISTAGQPNSVRIFWSKICHIVSLLDGLRNYEPSSELKGLVSELRTEYGALRSLYGISERDAREHAYVSLY